MERKHTFRFNTGNKLSQKINSLLGVWVGISFSGLLIWNGIVGMPSHLSSCTLPYPGSEANISLRVGDTLCIPPGETFIGRIEHFPKGAHIKVYNNAIFQPIGLWNAKGSIENQGHIVMEEMLTADGLGIDNAGKIDVQQAPEKDAKLHILNRMDGSIRFKSNISYLQAKLDMQNYGDVYMEGDFRLGKHCKIENNGKIVLQRGFVIEGQISNFGIVQTYENLLLGKNANIYNHCSIISPNNDYYTHKGFKNNGSLLTSASQQLEEDLELTGCASRFKSSKPIILQFFSSKVESELPTLRWQVEKGSRASYFELERSFDKNTFYGIDRIDVSEQEDKIYKISDNGLDKGNASGKVYYRLRMINNQGSTNYSPVLEMALKDKPVLGSETHTAR